MNAILPSRRNYQLTAALLAFFLASCAKKPVIQKADLEALDRKMIEIAKSGETEQMEELLSDDFKATVTAPTPAGPQTITADKAQYLDFVGQARRAISDYDITIEEVSYSISDYGTTASSESIVAETYTMGGKDESVRSHSRTGYKLIDGKLLVTSAQMVPTD